MTHFLVERQFHIAESEMPTVGRRSREVIEQQFPEITWHHSHVVVDEEGGVKSFCVYDAPDEETVRRHSTELGYHDIVGIYEIAGDVTPADFPPH